MEPMAAPTTMSGEVRKDAEPGLFPVAGIARREGLRRKIAARVMAFVTLGSGVLNIWSVVGPGLPERVERLRQYLPLEAVHYSRSFVLLMGFMLAAAGINMLRGKRRAWGLGLGLAAVSVLMHLTKGIDYEEAFVSALTAAGLWATRGLFTVRSRDIEWTRALRVGGVLAFLALAYGVAGFWVLEPGEFGRGFNWRDSLQQAVGVLLLQDMPGLAGRTWHARWFLESLAWITYGAMGWMAWHAFGPVLYRWRRHPSERAAARRLVEKYGRTALDFFKYSTDKSFHFSPGRSAFLAYRAALGYAVVLGDPVGAEEDLPGLVREFEQYCRDNGWSLAFHQASAEMQPLYEALGFRRLKLGDDAIVRLDADLLEGKRGKHFRSKLTQFERLGMRTRLYEPPLGERVLDEAESISEEWLKLPGRRERRFTLGWFERSYVRRTPLLAAEDAEGRMLGFVNFIPSYRKGEATLDLMRRRSDGPNGVMDYLFLRAFLHAREQGYDRFNLGMAPMSGFQEHESASAEEKAIHAFFRRMNFIFRFEGLKAYKAKFATEWEPKFLVYRSAFDLPRLPLVLSRISEIQEEE